MQSAAQQFSMTDSNNTNRGTSSFFGGATASSSPFGEVSSSFGQPVPGHLDYFEAPKAVGGAYRVPDRPI